MAVVWFSIASTRLGCGGSANPAIRAVPHHQTWWALRHLHKVDEVRQRGASIHLLFVGDSITQDYERDGPQPYLNFKPIWDELFAPHGAMNLGFNADQTGQVLWRLRHGEVDGLAPKDIVLLIGTNNLNNIGTGPRVQSPSQIAAGTMGVIAELHARMPSAQILVLSILPSDMSAERAAKTIAVNALVQEQLNGLRYARYLDVSAPFLDGTRVRTELYFDPKLHGPGTRSLHPDPVGQRLIARIVAAALYGN